MEILLADDHTLVRDGIKQLIQRQYNNAQVFEAASFEEARKLAAERPNLDLVLLDLVMPGMNGMEGITLLRGCIPATPIIVLSSSEAPNLVRRALDLGAKGYILKSSSSKVMLSAMELVFSGGVYLPPSLLFEAAAPANIAAGIKDGDKPASPALQNLTQRQREILVLLAHGKTNKEVGRDLGITAATVRTHINLIFKILRVTNRTQAGRLATQLGLVENS